MVAVCCCLAAHGWSLNPSYCNVFWRFAFEPAFQGPTEAKETKEKNEGCHEDCALCLAAPVLCVKGKKEWRKGKWQVSIRRGNGERYFVGRDCLGCVLSHKPNDRGPWSDMAKKQWSIEKKNEKIERRPCNHTKVSCVAVVVVVVVVVVYRSRMSECR